MDTLSKSGITLRHRVDARRRLRRHIAGAIAVALPCLLGSDLILHYTLGDTAQEVLLHIGLDAIFVAGFAGAALFGMRLAVDRDPAVRSLTSVLNGSAEGICLIDRAGLTSWANPAMGRLLGHDTEILVGRPYCEFVAPNDIPAVNDRLTGTIAEPTEPLEVALLHAHGHRVRVTAWTQPMQDEGGDVVGTFAFVTDISDTVLVRRELSIREQAIEQLPVAFCLADATKPDFPLVYVNRSFVTLTGYSHEECLGRNCRFLQGLDRPQPDAQIIAEALAKQKPGRAVLRNYRKDGSRFFNELTIVPLRSEDGSVRYVAGIQRDITETKRYADQLERLAYVDSLTGLPNRVRFEADLVGCQSCSGWTVAIIDITRLRDVNSTRGRHTGDAVLSQIAQRLTDMLTPGERAARIAGDQFALLLRVDSCSPTPESRIEEIMTALVMPYRVAQDRVTLAFTTGIAVIDADTLGPVDALQKAEVALYAAKVDRPRGRRLYDSDLGTRTLDTIDTTEQLRAAIEDNQFELFYQPKYALASRRMIGAEALIRWNHPVRGRQGPATFVPAAETSGLIVPIGAWVLRDAVRQIHAWRNAGLAPPCISVNVSRPQFDNRVFRDTVTDIAVGSALGPDSLALELTESMLMDTSAEFIATLSQLCGLGYSLAVDDFGTGFSSLNYLHHFPLSELKIDRSFIQDLPHDRKACSIVGVIVGLAHALSLSVTAEGVETAEQASWLASAGCDAAQGYHFSEPLPAERFAALLPPTAIGE